MQVQWLSTSSSSSDRDNGSPPKRREDPPSNRSTPTVSPTSSFSQPKRTSNSSNSAARQRAYLDEKRRQRVLYHLGDSSSSSNKSLSHHHHQDEEPSESESHHDPLHVTAMGLDPSNARASATSMSRKFFLTPPERLQVDQSVNLMDVETGYYDFESTHSSDLPKRRPNSSSNSNFLTGWMSSTHSQSHPATPSTQSTTSSGTPQGSLSKLLWSSATSFSPTSVLAHGGGEDRRQALANQGRLDSMMSVQLHNYSEASKHSAMGLNANFTSHSQRKANHRSFVEAFLDDDEELGVMSEQSFASASNRGHAQRRHRRRKRKQPKSKQLASTTVTPDKVQFPDDYDPNLWEQRAADAKTQPLLPTSDVDSAMDTVAHENKSKKSKRRRRGRRKRRLGRRRPTTARTVTRLRPGRLALVLGGLFVVLLVVLLILIGTGEILWHKWHPATTTTSSNDTLALVERNHSYLDLNALPTSTQILMRQDNSPQNKALEWLQDDPKTTLANSAAATVDFLESPLDGLAALQKFVLTTLYYATDGPHWKMDDDDHWMDLELNECDWFGPEAKYNGEFSVCNRYHQLHAILLPHHNLHGQLPTEEMTLLSNLKHIDLANNTLSGIVPGVWFEGWRNLEFFNVQENRLTGQLPTELGLLTNSNGLRELNFGSNRFTGIIPTELGGLIHHLDVLQLSENRLSGSIPTELGGGMGDDESSSLRALERLHLHTNDLTGEIPSELGLLTLLTDLQLHNNRALTPQVLPQAICDLPLLAILTVDCDIVTCPADCDCTCVETPPITASPTTTDDNDKLEQLLANSPSRPKIHKVEDLSPSFSSSSSNKEEPSSETRHHIHKINKDDAEEEAPVSGNVFSSSNTKEETKTSSHHHHTVHKVTTEDGEEQESISGNVFSASNLSPSASKAGEFMHGEASVLKRPIAQVPEKQELAGGSTILHRPSGHRFLRSSARDSL